VRHDHPLHDAPHEHAPRLCRSGLTGTDRGVLAAAHPDRKDGEQHEE
jgi:hypothetical protein